jgi:hypothetical protein
VLAQACTGDAGQRWTALNAEAARDVAVGIADAEVRSLFLRTVAAGPAGSLVSLASGRAVQGAATGACGVVVNLGGGTVIRLGARP